MPLIDDILEAHARGKLAHQQMRKIVAKHRQPADFARYFAGEEAVVKALSGAACFRADAAAAYIERARDGGREKLLGHLPALTPPYPLTWIEYNDTLDPTCDRAGILITAHGLRDLDAAERDGWRDTFTADTLASIAAEDRPQLAEHLGRAAWVVTMHICTDDRPAKMLTATGVGFIVPLSADGVSTGLAFPIVDPFVRELWRSSGRTLDDTLGDFTSAMGVACMTLALLHCKNVRTEERVPDPGLQKHRMVLGKPPAVTYRTLVIDPMRAAGAAGAAGAGDSPARAYHLVRGHFAVYSAERPLFGKHAGTFFVPAHVRGSAEAGIVLKDYALADGAGDAL